MEGIGTITLQSNDSKDVFFVKEVNHPGYEGNLDEEETDFVTVDFEQSLAWIAGPPPRLYPVHISGDTACIYGFYKGRPFNKEFTIAVYVEFEEAEELISVEPEDLDSNPKADPLDPIRVNL